MTRLALFFTALAAQAGAEGLVLDSFKYADSPAVQAVWIPQSKESPEPLMSMGADQVAAARFPCAFNGLKDWRVYWDREIKADLSKATQIVLKLRSGDPSAVGQGILYFRSGKGWYTLPAFSVGGEWREQVIELKQAIVEDTPTGWGSIDGVRLAFLPAASRETWVEPAGLSARAGWERSYAWKMGPYGSEAQARAAIVKGAKGSPLERDVKARLAAVDKLLAKAGKDAGGQKAILDARQKVAEAYALVQQPRKEFRGAWLHYGDGARAEGGERAARWKEAIPAMRAAGINAIFPNLLWSGVAYYPSKVVPVHPGVAKEGDYLQEILAAARPLGMQVHLWKVMWQFAEGWLAPEGVSEPFRKQGRLQVDKDGKEKPWLCPCDERNRRYELDALLEAAAFPVDGIHLDYIRFSGTDVSYSKMCKARFEKGRGKKVAKWPADAAPGGVLEREYGDFKRELITSFVREARAALKKKKPDLKLSAAVFAYPRLAQESVFQDWPKWMEEDLLDFICPMTYTEDPAAFRAATETQVKLAGAGRVFPGIQIIFDGGHGLAPDALVEEVRAARELGAPGVVFFEWREHLQDTLFPYVRASLFREGAAKDAKLSFRPKAALPAPAGPAQLVDDLEDGDLTNALGGFWGVESDKNNLGTLVKGQPLKAQSDGAEGSKFSIGLQGHFGKAQAPWPYALLYTGLNAGMKPADLSAYQGLEFWVRGEDRPMELLLKRAAVKDSGYPRAGFRAPKDWTKVTLNFADFKQPSWAAALPAGRGDVELLMFSPAGLNDQDFSFSVDSVKLLK